VDGSAAGGEEEGSGNRVVAQDKAKSVTFGISSAVPQTWSVDEVLGVDAIVSFVQRGPHDLHVTNQAGVV
jgi:chemotaxis response regulator CheB